MSSKKDWPARSDIHLLGGMRLLNSKPFEFVFKHYSLQGKVCHIKAAKYGEIYSELKCKKLVAVGVDFYTDIHELEGAMPARWRLYHEDKSWKVAEAGDRWMQIATAARSERNAHLWDLAGRISYQFRACQQRVRQLSNAYTEALSARLKRGEFVPGLRYFDGYISLTYMAAQAFLVDACILRDYLCEAAAAFVLQGASKPSAQRITKAASLLRGINRQNYYHSEVVEVLSAYLSTGGWMKELGDYRDIVVHSTPLENSSISIRAYCEKTTVWGGDLPYISCPLPNDAEKLMRARSAEGVFDDFEGFVSEMKTAMGDTAKGVDAATYALGTMGRLADLALLLGRDLAVAPFAFVLLDGINASFRVAEPPKRNTEIPG